MISKKEYNKLWKIRNRDKDLEYKRRYARKWIICIREGSKVRCIRLEKPRRPKPDKCELCGKPRRLEYHHWITDKPYIGMWICRPCHKIVTLYEHGWFEKYEQLKDNIAQTYQGNEA